MVKMALFELLETPKMISHKIWETEKSWNFHTVLADLTILPKKVGNSVIFAFFLFFTSFFRLKFPFQNIIHLLDMCHFGWVVVYVASSLKIFQKTAHVEASLLKLKKRTPKSSNWLHLLNRIFKRISCRHIHSVEMSEFFCHSFLREINFSKM